MSQGVECEGGPGAAFLPRCGGDQIGEARFLHQKRELAGNATSGSDGLASEFWEDEFRIRTLLDFLNEPLFEFGMNGDLDEPLRFALPEADGFSLHVHGGPFQIGKISCPASGVESGEDQAPAVPNWRP